MISVQATNQGPEFSDRSWLQLRSPFTVGSVWSSGETRRPLRFGRFFFCEKKNPFFVFQRFLFNKEKASNLFQIFPVSCVQMSIFKNVFKATPKSFYASFLQLEKKTATYSGSSFFGKHWLKQLDIMNQILNHPQVPYARWFLFLSLLASELS